MTYRLLRLFGADGEGDEGEEPEGDSSGSDDGSGDNTRSLTTDELEKMTARAADRASRRATKALAEELGFETVGQLKEWASETKEAQEEAKSEDEKAREELARRTAEAEKAQRQLRTQRLSVEIDKAIVRAGVTDEKKLDRLQTLVYAEVAESDDEDAWVSEIEEALDGLKTDMPELFSGKKSHGSGDGGSRGPAGSDDSDESEEEEEAWRDEYARKGMIEHDFSKL